MTAGVSQLVLPGLLAEPEDVWFDSEESFMEESLDSFVHISIMKAEIIEAFRGTSGTVVDATLGGGGHTEALLDAYPSLRVIGVDRDPTARRFAQERLRQFGDRFSVIDRPFSMLGEELNQRGIDKVDGILADLGVSSPQLDDPERGMSFRREGPIDMRMDPEHGETALELIGRLSDDELADVIFQYGDERRSRRIARSLKRAFADNHLETTLDLRRAIVRAVGPVRVGGVDPATRTFQALRIKVNDELGELESLMATAAESVRVGGTCAILTFHSLEDRIVKNAFRSRALWQPLTKKPQTPSELEQIENPRSRSAKLRVASRLGDEC